MASSGRISSPPPGGLDDTLNETPRRAMLRSIQEDTFPEPPRSRSPPLSLLGRRQRSSSPNPFSDDSTPTPRASAPSTFNAPAFARSLVANKKVKLNNPTPLYDFANMSPAQREIASYGLMLEIREGTTKKQEEVVQAWSMDKALADTIRDYTVAILMAPTIAAYQLDTSIVTKLLVSKNIYPESWGVLSPRMAAIRKHIGSIASDKRYEFKTKIGESIEKNECLSKLAKRILNGTKLRVTAAFRGRVAFLRHQYKWNPDERGPQFWTFVDKKLKELREAVNNDATRLAVATTKYIAADEKQYTEGAQDSFDLATDDAGLPPLQVAAEQALAPQVPVATTGAPTTTLPAAT